MPNGKDSDNMRSLHSLSRISFYAGIIFAVSLVYGTEIVITPDSCDNRIDRSIYFVTREPDYGQLRVTLWEYWGASGMQIDYIRFDEYEGLPGVIASFGFGHYTLMDVLDVSDVYMLEFKGWIDRKTFEIGFNYDKSFTLHVDDGEFTFSYD